MTAAVAGLFASAARADTTFSTQGLSLTLNSLGQASDLHDTVTGVDRIATLPQYLGYFCLVKHGGTMHEPTAFTAIGNNLVYTFGDILPPPVVTIAVTSGSKYLAFTVTAVTPSTGIEEIRFVNLGTSGSQSSIPGDLVRFSDNGTDRYLGISALDIYTDTAANGGPGTGGPLTAMAVPNLPNPTPIAMIGRKAALYASGTTEAQVSAVMQAIEGDFGIALGFTARSDPYLRKSCFFWQGFLYSQRDLARQFAEDAGAGRIMLGSNAWGDRVNRWAPAPTWPNVTELRNWVANCQFHGILVGAHTLAPLCYYRSHEHIEVGAHPALLRDRTITLARNISSSQVSGLIETTTPPTGWPTADRNRDLVIGGEIIEYQGGLQLTGPPYGFRGPFVRAKNQTGAGMLNPQNHSAGATIGRLVPDVDGFGYCWSIPAGGVAMNVADMAATLNAARVDFIYTDCNNGADPEWFGQNAVFDELYQALNPKPRWMESSSVAGSMAWAFATIGGQIDYHWWLASFREEVNRNVEVLNDPGHVLRRKQLGWALLSPSQTNHTRPDDVEYLLAKSIAYDAPIVWHVTMDRYLLWPYRVANAHLMRTVETLRLNGYFSPQQRAELQRVDKDFMLFREPDGTYHMRPVSPLNVAGGAGEVRAFISDDEYNGKRYVTMWTADETAAYDLLLDGVASSAISLSNYRGDPLGVTRTTNAQIRIPLSGRVYLSLSGVPNPQVAFANASLTQ